MIRNGKVLIQSGCLIEVGDCTLVFSKCGVDQSEIEKNCQTVSQSGFITVTLVI